MLSALRQASRRGFATNASVQGFNGAVGNTPLVCAEQPFRVAETLPRHLGIPERPLRKDRLAHLREGGIPKPWR